MNHMMSLSVMYLGSWRLDSSMLLLMQPCQPSRRGFPHLKMWETNLGFWQISQVLQMRSWQSNAMHWAPHCTMKGTLIWTVGACAGHLPSKTMSLLELITFMHDKDLSEIYPNVWTALRIALTLPVTVAEAERSFSKLKLIKSYRSRCSEGVSPGE